MSNVKTASMKEKEEHDSELGKFLKYVDSRTTIVDKLPFRDDDPFLIKKLEQAYKTLEEAPLPDFLLKGMSEGD
ncbi:MAG TPA: hypothetical protein VHW43_03930 [Puia sp.]|jgi:hypothetical protein|nr:hypothetical protein [Puia sp.]